MLPAGHLIDDKYTVVRVIGRGGMGIVYEGIYGRIQRRVAIKVLHAEVAARAEMVQRFEREAQMAGRIGSDHVVEVLDVGAIASGERYIVMEFLDGQSLGERLKARGRLGELETAVILRQILVGLAAAHRAGVVHRDIKPDNVYLVAEKAAVRDWVKLVDFGVSKLLPEEELAMTKSGAVMGTPYYMSPEQARGQQVTPASDLYSACVVAYQAVSGQVPFVSKSFNELLFKIALEEPPPLATLVPGVDPTFARIVMRGLERDPADRHTDADGLIRELDAWLSTQPVAASRTSAASFPSPPPSLSPQFMSSSMHERLPAFVAARQPLQVRYSPASPLATSHSALSVTAGDRGSSRLLVATVVCVAALAGVGIAIFGYRFSGLRNTSHAAASAPPAHADATSLLPTPTAPSASASATLSDATAVTLGDPQPSAAEKIEKAPPRKPGRPSGSGVKATATPAEPAPTTPGRGRTIDGSL